MSGNDTKDASSGARAYVVIAPVLPTGDDDCRVLVVPYDGGEVVTDGQGHATVILRAPLGWMAALPVRAAARFMAPLLDLLAAVEEQNGASE